MGDAHYITLPQKWREAHGIRPGDTVVTHFKDQSLMAVTPHGYEMSETEELLLDLLLKYPSFSDVKEAQKQMKTIVESFENEA